MVREAFGAKGSSLYKWPWPKLGGLALKDPRCERYRVGNP